MKSIEKLENAISQIIMNIEENDRIDRISKEKLTESLNNLYVVTGEMKDEKDVLFDGLKELINKL